jgi:hypothetical protein
MVNPDGTSERVRENKCFKGFKGPLMEWDAVGLNAVGGSYLHFPVVRVIVARRFKLNIPDCHDEDSIFPDRYFFFEHRCEIQEASSITSSAFRKYDNGA